MLKIKNIGSYLRNLFLLLLCFNKKTKQVFLKPKVQENSKNLNVLVITTGKIGDTVCITPFFREFKKEKKNCKITVLMYRIGKPILKFNPNVDEIIEIDGYLNDFKKNIDLIRIIKNKNFDWSFNLFSGPLTNTLPFLSGIPNRAMITDESNGFVSKIGAIFNNYRLFHKKRTLLIDSYLQLLGFLDIKTINKKKEIYLNPKIEQQTNKFLEEKNIHIGDLNFVIGVTAAFSLKEWILDRYAELADRLIDKYGVRIIFIGTEKDKPKIDAVINLMKKEAINLSGLMDLEELPYLFKRTSLFIGPDSGPLYIANALDVPVVDILGPVDIYSQPPIYEKCEAVVKNIYCQPCVFTPGAVHFCNEGHMRCMKEITVKDVEVAIGKIIKKYNNLNKRK